MGAYVTGLHGKYQVVVGCLTVGHLLSRIPRLQAYISSGNSSVVEHRLAKARVEGSNPFSRSIAIIVYPQMMDRTSALPDTHAVHERGLFPIVLWLVECHQIAKMVFSE